MLNFKKHASYRNVLHREGNQEKSHFSNTGKILQQKSFSDIANNFMEHKRYYYTFDNSLLFTGEHSEHYTTFPR